MRGKYDCSTIFGPDMIAWLRYGTALGGVSVPELGARALAVVGGWGLGVTLVLDGDFGIAGPGTLVLALGVEGSLPLDILPKDSLRLIQLVSVSVTFLYFALLAEVATGVATELSGALTCVEVVLGVGSGCVSNEGGGTELDRGERTVVAPSRDRGTSEVAGLFASCSAADFGTQLLGVVVVAVVVRVEEEGGTGFGIGTAPME